MPNGTYGGVRGKEAKVGQKTFVSRPTRSSTDAINRVLRVKPHRNRAVIHPVCSDAINRVRIVKPTRNRVSRCHIRASGRD